MLTQSFYTKLNEVSGELGMNPRDLLLVISLESGGNPAAKNTTYSKNPNFQARGLIQFMPNTLKGMGVSQNAALNFDKVPAETQLDYVKQYVKAHQSLIGGKPFTSAVQYYVANLFPKSLQRWQGDDPIANKNVVVVAANAKDPRERAAYKANTILDADKDGKITVGDLTTVLMRQEQGANFQSMQSGLNAVAGNGSVSDKEWAKGQEPKAAPPPGDQKELLAKFLKGVENLLESAAKDETPYLIKVSSDNQVSEIEYARILQAALKEELKADSDIYVSSCVEVGCKSRVAVGDLQMFCEGVSDAFFVATGKLGGVKVKTLVEKNAQSKNSKLTPKMAEINYRKFHLKLAAGNK